MLLRSRDRAELIEGLRQASALRLRRSDLCSLLAPLLDHGEAEIQRLAQTVLRSLGGVAAEAALAEAPPLHQESRPTPAALQAPPPEEIPRELGHTARYWLGLVAVASLSTLAVLGLIWWLGARAVRLTVRVTKATTQKVVEITGRFLRKMQQRRQA